MKRSMLSVVLAVLVTLVFAPAALANTWIVDNDFADCPNADTASIQDAVNRADPGDTIRVCAGSYAEDVTVNKPALKLRGHGGDHGARGQCFDEVPSAPDPAHDAIVEGVVYSFRLEADDIELEHFVVQGARYGIDTDPRFSGYEIRGNLVQHNTGPPLAPGAGLNFRSSGAQEALVRHNCFRGNDKGTESELPGKLENARIEHNSTFRNPEGGIRATGDGERERVTIEYNAGRQDGLRGPDPVPGRGSIMISHSTDSSVSYNDVTRSAVGILAGEGNVGLEISRNRIREVAFNGIIVQGEPGVPPNPINDDLNISHNDVVGNGENGIALSSLVFTEDSLISHNRTDENGGAPGCGARRNCGNGIFVGRTTSGTRNRFEHNHARRNHRDGILSFGDAVVPAPAGNFYTDNHMRDNIEHDAHDDNRPGNVWLNNHCETDFPTGTICER